MKFLDLLYSRYSNPMELLNGMIRTKRFTEFVDNFLEIHNQDLEDKTLWEFYLAKIEDMTFNEFVQKVKGSNQENKESDLKEAVQDSFEMLQGFVPE